MTPELQCATHALDRALSDVLVLPLRLRLAGLPHGIDATLLRSVWGKALHDLSIPAYDAVFRTDRPERGADGRIPPSRPQPYVLSLAETSESAAGTLELLLIGSAIGFEAILLRAWQLAGRYGVGRSRTAVNVVACDVLGPDGRALSSPRSTSWPLSDATWPLHGSPETTPCRLDLITPLRLVTRDSHTQYGHDESPGSSPRLVRQPTFAQLMMAASRRISPFLPPSGQSAWRELVSLLAADVERHPAEPFHGARQTVPRWSATQQTRLSLSGVRGTLDLPFGPGPYWKLLAAARWLHIGKNTTHGLGRFRITATRHCGDTRP